MTELELNYLAKKLADQLTEKEMYLELTEQELEPVTNRLDDVLLFAKLIAVLQLVILLVLLFF